MSYKTNKNDFELFKSECHKWINYLGLIDWEVHFFQEDCDGARATCLADYNNKIATIALIKEWDYKPPQSEIKRIAFHEVCQLLVAPLRLIAEGRYITSDQVEIASHYIIRVLENTMFVDVNPPKRKGK